MRRGGRRRGLCCTGRSGEWDGSPPSKAVEEVGGGVQGLYPVAGKERRLKEKEADHISGGSNHALGPAVLSRGVGARQT
jgi:hypothetical protein